MFVGGLCTAALFLFWASLSAPQPAPQSGSQDIPHSILEDRSQEVNSQADTSNTEAGRPNATVLISSSALRNDDNNQNKGANQDNGGDEINNDDEINSDDSIRLSRIKYIDKLVNEGNQNLLRAIHIHGMDQDLEGLEAIEDAPEQLRGHVAEVRQMWALRSEFEKLRLEPAGINTK